MISLQTADNVLKSYYLDAVKDALDTKTSPFLAMVERTSENVYGKDVKKVVRVGVSGGIIAGTETGDLPSADSSSYLQMTATLKNLYGTIEISDKAIRSAQGNEGAFVNILNAEMEHLLHSAKYNLNRMAMGAGDGLLSYGTKIDSKMIRLDEPAAAQVGMRVYVTYLNGTRVEDGVRKIVAVERSSGVITLDGGDLPVVQEESVIVCMVADAEELTGIRNIFSSNPIYGLTKDEFNMIAPLEVCLEDYIKLDKMQEMIDRIEEASGTAPNLILCGWGVRRALLRHCSDMGVTLPVIQLESGHSAISFNGIPVVVDRFCKKGDMFFLNTNHIKLYQLGDWEWMESDDGKILHQVPGKPVYTATLVKYAELVFERPNTMGLLTDIYEE